MNINRPNFYHPPHEIFPATAWLEIYRTGEIKTDYSYESGTPANFFNQIDYRFKIDEQLADFEIEELIEKVKDLAKKLIETDSTEVHNDIERICELHVTDYFGE